MMSGERPASNDPAAQRHGAVRTALVLAVIAVAIYVWAIASRL